jgi:hypothetical protein
MFSDSHAAQLWLPKVERFLRAHRVKFALSRA